MTCNIPILATIQDNSVRFFILFYLDFILSYQQALVYVQIQSVCL